MSNSNDITIRKGETLEIYITIDDESAQSVRFIASKNNENVIDVLASFATVDGVREATITTDDTDIITSSYDYMLVITYEDGTIEKLPEGEGCDDGCEDDDCGFPQLIICKTLTSPGVS